MWVIGKLIDVLKGKLNGGSTTEQKIIAILEKQTIILQSGNAKLDALTRVEEKNGERLESVGKNLSVAMDRQITLRDLEGIRGRH